MGTKKLFVWLGFALSLFVAMSGNANAGSSNRLGGGQKAMAPIGFQIFCLKNPRECRGGGRSEIVLTKGMMGSLDQVNQRVNRAIQPHRDGKRDVWSLNVSSGDCEDYVLAKRKKLIETGLPGGALRIAHVKTRTGADHAILIVKTNQGDLVLDNLTPRIKNWNDAGLKMVAMSSANPKNWTTR